MRKLKTELDRIHNLPRITNPIKLGFEARIRLKNCLFKLGTIFMKIMMCFIEL